MATKFEDLGLGKEVLQAVSEAGYDTPTPIQEKAIPFILMNRDVLGCAQTGTGKTASFTLPMIDILAHGRSRARMPRSIILAPTRELAAQVADNFTAYGQYHRLTMALLIGGVAFGEQEKILDKGADVLIATPGRLMDHISRGKILLSDTKIVVIDEADRMLDMGFIPDIEKIIGMLPPLRQTVMFSATMPTEIKNLASKFLSNPKEITVNPPSSTATTITQRIAYVGPRQKRKTLEGWLQDDTIQNGIIFCNRKRDVASLHRSLEKKGYSIGALHGDMDQHSRMECLEKFKNNEIKILTCSDVAARGLDISAVSHVFNYDVPMNPEDYVHRIGRTGRAGREGAAFTLVTDMDKKAITAIEKIIGSELVVLEGFEQRENRGESREGKEAREQRDNRKDERTDRNNNRKKNQKSFKQKRTKHDIEFDIGVEPESNLPFGQTPGVPAFLLREIR